MYVSEINVLIHNANRVTQSKISVAVCCFSVERELMLGFVLMIRKGNGVSRDLGLG